MKFLPGPGRWAVSGGAAAGGVLIWSAAMKLWIFWTLASVPALLVAGGGCLRTESGPPQQSAGALELKVSAPERAAVGDRVTFKLTVTNRGREAATGLLAKVGFDAGLAHEAGPGPIEHDLADLAPGETQEFDVAFRVVRPGRLGMSVELERISRMVVATSQAAVEGVEVAGSQTQSH